MKLIFEYEEETTEHVPDVDDNKERERTGKEAAAEDITIELPKDLMRKELPLPNVSEITVVRHYTNISRMNFGVDSWILSIRFLYDEVQS